MVYGAVTKGDSTMPTRDFAGARLRVSDPGCRPVVFRQCAGRKSRGGVPDRGARGAVWRPRIRVVRKLAGPHRQLGRSRWAGALFDLSDGGGEPRTGEKCVSLGEVSETVAPAGSLRGADSWGTGEEVLSSDYQAFRFASR